MGEATTIGGKDLFLALWRSALILIEDWECKLIPDPHKLDLEKANDLKVTEVVTWTGMRVREFVNSLNEVPKN